MFNKIAEKATLAAYNTSLKQGRLACPSCNARPSTAPEGGPNDLIPCESCGASSSGMEWAQTGKTGVFQGDPDRIPPTTRITRSKDESGTTVWEIPASGNSGGFMMFGIFWCLITGIVSSAFLFGDPKENTGSGPDWLIYPFFALFWAVGLGMIYLAVRNRYARHRFIATPDTVTLQRELFGKIHTKQLAANKISSIEQKEFYQKNHQSVYGIQILGSDGKLRFGSMLTEEEKAWLVSDFRKVIIDKNEAVAASVMPSGAVVPNLSKGAPFSVPIPSHLQRMLPMAIILTFMGIGVATFGVFHMKPRPVRRMSDAPREVDTFRFPIDLASVDLFSTILIINSSLMVIGGLTLTVFVLRARNTEKLLEGNDTEIALRTYQHGRVLKEKVFPRASVTGVRAIDMGSSNGNVHKRIELIVENQTETLCKWAEQDRADELVRLLRSVL